MLRDTSRGADRRSDRAISPVVGVVPVIALTLEE
jgi:FlaG/FlaF family flagellin (archaellin)